jgi:hypothetical protein
MFKNKQCFDDVVMSSFRPCVCDISWIEQEGVSSSGVKVVMDVRRRDVMMMRINDVFVLFI